MKYLVALPPDYNPSLRYPLVIMFHGASSTPANALTWFDRGAAERGFVLAAPEFTAGKSGTADEHYAVSAVAEDLSRRVRLDPDRVFLCGASMGGHAAWDAATAQFDRLAGLLTIIGCPQGLAWTYGGSHAQHLAVYAIDGDLDINAPAILRRATVALQKFGCDTTYVEYFGQGHVAYPQEYPNALDWMRRKSRDAAPKKLTSYVVRKEEAWRAWANVEEFSGPKYPQNVAGAQLASLSGLIGTWSDNTLKLETFNVGKLEIFFDRRLVDFNQKIVIVANDKECANELVKPSIEFALKTCEERGDRGVWWEASTTVRPPKKR